MKLPVEINSKIKADEMDGEYLCLRCKGWGYIVERKEFLGKLGSFPLAICPECRGKCVIDWIQRATQE